METTHFIYSYMVSESELKLLDFLNLNSNDKKLKENIAVFLPGQGVGHSSEVERSLMVR